MNKDTKQQQVGGPKMIGAPFMARKTQHFQTVSAAVAGNQSVVD